MAISTSNEGTYEETTVKTIQEHLSSDWKTTESDTVTTVIGRRESEDETKEECGECGIQD